MEDTRLYELALSAQVMSIAPGNADGGRRRVGAEARAGRGAVAQATRASVACGAPRTPDTG